MAIIFYYYFFTIGINNFSEILFKNTLTKKKLNSKYSIPIKSILTFISLLVYCSLCNLILLIPFLFKLLNFSNEAIVKLNSFSQYAINISAILLVIYGALITSRILVKKNYKEIFFTSDNLINNISIPLIISFLIYFILAPKNPDLIMFDTGYYHYPTLKLISTFGLGIGVGSFFSGYGIYNLQTFGQLPFHNLFSASETLSPSLNIIFLATYISFFISEYLIFKDKKNIYFSNIPYKNIVLIYFGVSTVFCSSSFISTIASYSSNMPMFVAGSISFYIIFSSSFFRKRDYDIISIFLLTIFAPLLKTSAITICLLNISYLIIYNLMFQKYTNNLIYSFKAFFRNIFEYTQNKVMPRYLFILVITCYLIAIATNIIQTGYVVFPSSLTGPIGQYALNESEVINLKMLILSWHRYSGNLNSIIPSYNFFEWFPYFIRSRNGIIVMIYWISPAIIALLLNLLNKNNQNTNGIDQNNIFKLYDHVILISIFILLNIIFLIPAPSYTPWLTPVIVFLAILSYNSFQFNNLLLLKIKRYVLFFVFTFLIIISLKFSFSNQIILNDLSNISFSTKFPDLDYKVIKYKPKRWRPINMNNENLININVSQTNQCWNIPAPCITRENYINLVNNK